MNYSSNEYRRYGTGFTKIAQEMFYSLPYGKDRYKGRIKIMDELKQYLKRELTDYEKDFIEYNSKPDEFDESLKRNLQVQNVLSLIERVEKW